MHMKLNFKRLMAMFLSIMMVVGMMPTMVFAMSLDDLQDAINNGTGDIVLDGDINENASDPVVIDFAAGGSQSYPTLAEAFAAATTDDEVEIRVAGEYSLSGISGKNITVTGKTDGVVFNNIGAFNMGGADVTFNKVTFTYAENSTYKGLQHSGDLVYNNCTINGQVFLYGESETFNNCVFNTTDSNNYNVWTYGAQAVEFNGCTFNSAGKSVLVYNEAGPATELEVIDTDFFASGSVSGKAAIEIDTSAPNNPGAMDGTVITIDAATTATGFAEDTISGSSLWNDQKVVDGQPNGGTTSVVVVAGETVKDSKDNAPAVTYVAQVGETKYESFNDALADADGKTIKLLTDVTVTGATVEAGKNITIDLNDNTMTLSVTGFAWSPTYAFTVNGELTFIGDGNAVVNVSTTPMSMGSAIFVADGGKLTVNSGNFTFPQTINGAIAVVYGDMVINGGVFESNGATSMISTPDSANITITNGEFKTFPMDTGDGKTVSISGGKYPSEVPAEWIADGYAWDVSTGTVVEKAPAVPTGTLTNCYTSDSGYWGECGGNASESFMFKFYNGTTYMGYTSLNNVDGIIDGDVYVSWHIKLNTASNTDEFWTMAWDVQPTLTMQPTRVEQWVDGVKVAEAAVEPNWSDRIFPVVAAVTDENGKILSYVNGTDGHTLDDAVAEGGNITLLRDVVLTAPLTVPAGTTVVLDLNGHTMTYNSTTQGEAMITNKGTLTINDSVGTGEIYYNYTGEADSSYGKGNYTISNGGNLTVNGGKIHIANLRAHAKYPIDNNSTTGDAILVINGGHLYNYNTSAIRQFCNSTTNKNSVTINGGLIEGYCAIWVQNPGKNTVNGSLSITGGEIKTTAAAYVNGTSALKDVASRIYCTIDGEGGAWSTDSSVSLTGGTFNENVNLAKNAPAAITIGDAADFKGYVEIPYAFDGVTINSLADLKAFRDAVNGGDTYAGKTVVLNADIDLKGEEWTPIGNSTNQFQGTFDGNDKTISNLVITGNNSDVGFFGFTTNGEIKNLTINNANVSGYLNVAVVAGTPYTSKYTKINVTGHVEVNGFAYVGGVGGKNVYANWTDITVNVDDTSYVKATSTDANGNAYRTYVGGVVGFNGEGGHTFKNITSNIDVIGDVCDIGGIFGIAHYGNNFENITCTGDVTNTIGSHNDGDDAATDVLETGLIAGVWHNQVDNTVTFTNISATGTIYTPNVQGVTFVNGGLIGNAYSASNNTAENSGSLIIDGKEAWLVVPPEVIGIYTWDDLKALDARVEGGDMLEGVTVKLMNDIDLYEMGTGGEPVSFNPIGANSAYFKGTFDGQGHTIKNMYQSGWALGYDWDHYGTIGLFAYIWNATIKNLTIENAECLVEGGNVAGIAGCAWGDCTFENITIKNSTYATYNNRAGGVVGYTGGEGTMTFKDITVDEDTVIAALWGSYDCTLGGVVGSTQSPTKFHFEDVTVECKLDCYNDVTASYKWYSYRMCGMLIGRMNTLQTDAPTEVDPRGVVTIDNVKITIGEWANQTYIWDDSLSKGCQRVEPGYQYGGVDVSLYPDAEITDLGFSTIIGGPQSQRSGYYGSDITKLEALEGFEDQVAELEVEDIALEIRSRVAIVGETYYTKLQTAIDKANGEKITLIADVTENITIADGATVIIDLGGKTLNGYIAPCKPASLTISNGSIKNSDSSKSAIEINAGELELVNVNIDGARHAVRIDGAVEAAINGGTYRSAIGTGTGTYHAANISGAANVTIIDGTFVGPKGTTADSGAAVNVQKGATVTINGGNFSGGKNNTLAATGTLTVTGGTFDQDPTAYVATGYKAVNKNGTWTVKEDIVLSGSGTATDPYIISNLKELKAFRDFVNEGYTYADKYIKLTADINLSNEVWIPIGTSNYDKTPTIDGVKMFAGNFDGGNHTITGLTSEGYVPASSETGSTEYSFGLFGYVYGANISNVNFADVDIDCGTRTDSAGNEVYGSGVAALIGYYVPANEKTTVISNCHVLSGTVKASNNMGGLIGHMDSQLSQPAVDITIENCSNATDVTTEAREAGGILGLMNSAREGNYLVTMRGTVTFKNCVNTGDITSLGGGAPSAGGILGRDHNQAAGQRLKIVFDGCENSGTITVTANGETHAAGIGAGYYSTGAWLIAKDCTNTGNVVVNNLGSEVYAGGLISYGGVVELIDSTSTGTVTGGIGNKYVGGAQNILFLEKMDNFTDTVNGYTYYLNGGTSPEYAALVDDAAGGGNFHLVETAYKTGCKFGGWYDNAALTGEAYTALNSSIKTYYAKWIGDEPVAKIGDTTYTSLQEAIEKAQTGETVVLLADIALTEADLVAGADRKVLLDVVGKDITLNMNGKKISVVHEDAFTNDYIVAVIRVADGAGLTVTGNGTIDVKVLDDNPDMAYMFWKRGTTGHLTIENGTYHMNDSADSMVYTNGNEIVNIKGGTWTLDAYGTRGNREPWIFNVAGAGDNHVIVTGGTFNADINRQHWSNEAVVPETHYTIDNGDGTYTVNPGAVAYVSTGMTTGPYFVRKNIGYATLTEAITAAVQYTDPHVTLLADYEGALEITGEVKLHLNGHTIKSDVSTIVVNGGNLTIDNDKVNSTNKADLNTDDGVDTTITFEQAATEGKIITSSNTNDYEAIAVKNGGKLTLESGAVESGAYGIYVYTSGGTANINGGSVTIGGTNVDGMTVTVGSAAGSANISGGTFEANGVNWPMYAWDGTISITGGTFDFNPSSDYVAYGYAASEKVIGSETWYEVASIEPVAYIGNNGYYNIEKAIEAANDGDVITVNTFTHSGDLLIDKKVTLVAAEGATVQINGQLQIKADGVTVKGLKVNCGGTAVQINAKDILVENCELTGANGLYQSYTDGTVTFKDSTITGDTYGIHFDGSDGGNIVIDNCVITGWTSFAASLEKVTIKDSEFADGNYDLLRFYQNAEVTNTKFTAGMRIDSGNGGTGMEGIDLKFNGCSMTDGSDFTKVFPESVIEASDVYVDGTLLGQVNVAKIGDTYYKTFVDALKAVQNGETITVLDVEGSERKTEIDFTKAITFTITGNSDYELPTITFTNATVNIVDANIEIGELDARQNATINVKNSTVETVGGSTDGIVKAYFNGKINIENSKVYAHQFTVMGVVNLTGTSELTVTWQTNVYGNGLITIGEDATLNTAAMHLTGKDYSGRDNTDDDRVGKPAQITVDGGTLNVGTECISINGADYNYNSSHGINIGTIAGKQAVLDIVNGAKVNIYMANGETANIGADGTVNVNGTLTVGCRAANGTATLVNNGSIVLTNATSVVTANECGNVTTDVEGYELTYADDKYVLKKFELKEFFGTNLTLGNELDINFAFSTSYVDQTGYAVIVREYADDRADETLTINLSDCTISGKYYVIKYAGIAAKEMCDEVKVTIYDANGKQISITKTDSIRDYILRNVDKENIATSSTRTAEETRTLLIDMLNYGAAAQVKFNYNTADLANSTLTDAQKAYGTQIIPKCEDNRSVSGVNVDAYYGTQFVLESKISMQIAIKTSAISGGTATINFVDHYGVSQTVTINAADCTTSGSYTVFTIDKIVVADGRCDVTCVFKNAAGDEVVTVVDSLESYVARNANKNSWLYEIMKFSDAAYASLH